MFPLNVSAANLPSLENSFRNVQVTQCVDDNPNMNTNRMDISDIDVAPAKTDLSNLKVTVGIDEDLQMILEMDPSIVDLVRNPRIFRYSEKGNRKNIWSKFWTNIDSVFCTPPTINLCFWAKYLPRRGHWSGISDHSSLDRGRFHPWNITWLISLA